MSLCCPPYRSLAVLGAAVLLAGLALCQSGDKPKKVALLVGVNKYDKRGFAEFPLPYAERDADEMAVELRKAGFDVRLLKSSSRGDDRATRANLDKALDAILRGRNADDIVLVGLAGHGVQMAVKGPDGKSRQEAFFCPADAVQGEPATMLGMTELIDKLNRQGGRNLVLVDACRNDPDPSRGGRGIDGDTVVNLPLNTAVLFSCSKGQRAWESAKAGGGHGIFFHFVLEGLRGAAKGADGQVTWSRLTDYVKNEVTPEKVKALQPAAPGDDPQTPHEVANLRGRSPVLVDLGKGGPDIGKVEKKGLGKTETVEGGGVRMEFVRIPAGTFRMGSPKSERDAVIKQYNLSADTLDDEQPVHEVEITRDFYLGKYTVTRGQFRAFVKDANYKTEAEEGDGGYGWNQDKKTWEKSKDYHWLNPGFAQTDDHPVVEVSWHDAVKFCAWLSRKTGRQVRLPTEAEWEYACRAGSTARYFFGEEEEMLARYANVADAAFRKATGKDWGIQADDGYAFTAPVGSFQPNAWGLYDMHGNVWQWCQDYYDKDYYKNSTKKDPQGPEKGDRRVLRGGSWYSNPGYCRAALRLRNGPAYRYGSDGLRVCFRLD